MKNRLKLDFSLDSTFERLDFVNDYVNNPQFKDSPLTPSELETIANYVLWGKDPISGKNVVQEKSIQIETRNSTWAAPAVESFDALIESPTFNEAQFTQSASAPTRKTRETFSRSAARLQCPASLLPTLEDLWRRIDWLDLAICYYELDHNKRQNPPRPKLLAHFTTSEQLIIHEKAAKWSMHQYLKNRHLLVELRREQYTIRDSYVTSIPPSPSPSITESEPPFSFGEDVTVLPLGLRCPKTSLLFREKDELNPFVFTPSEIKELNEQYWGTRRRLDGFEEVPYVPNEVSPLWSDKHSQFVIDFRNPSHVASLISKFSELQNDVANAETDEAGANPFQLLFDTMLYYIRFTELDPIQSDLISLKLQHHTNVEIASILNKRYQRAYTPNYISTVFRQRIIPKICDAVRAHYEQVGLIFFPEEFKTCNTCGKVLLVTEDNFMRRTRSRDGYSNRCKRCDSLARKKKTKKEVANG